MRSRVADGMSDESFQMWKTNGIEERSEKQKANISYGR